MALGYTQPEPGLARELREVAGKAGALRTVLTKRLNFDLAPDFPKEQLLDICRSLEQLPNGTAEGCRATLDYARNRLRAIRREHVVSEELDVSANDKDVPPPVLRDSLIDERLCRLIDSTTTALAEYRRSAAEAQHEEPPPETAVVAPSDVTEAAVAQSLRLESDLAVATKVVDETTKPNSPRADNLKRQLQDGRALNRLARAELRMPKVVVGWYRQIVLALKEYPSLIRNTASALKVGADVVEIWVKRRHDFERNWAKFRFDEFRKTCDALVDVSDVLEKGRRGSAPIVGPALNDPGLPDRLDRVQATARGMILAGQALPSAWRPQMRQLDFSRTKLDSLTLLSDLTGLQKLNLSFTTVSDVSPLAGLTGLQKLNLSFTKVSDVSPLAGLTGLEKLNLGHTGVSDVSPLSHLRNLRIIR